MISIGHRIALGRGPARPRDAATRRHRIRRARQPSRIGHRHRAARRGRSAAARCRSDGGRGAPLPCVRPQSSRPASSVRCGLVWACAWGWALARAGRSRTDPPFVRRETRIPPYRRFAPGVDPGKATRAVLWCTAMSGVMIYPIPSMISASVIVCEGTPVSVSRIHSLYLYPCYYTTSTRYQPVIRI